jgi:hypothetical protein
VSGRETGEKEKEREREREMYLNFKLKHDCKLVALPEFVLTRL